MPVTITDESETRTVVEGDSKSYELRKDGATGDWAVMLNEKFAQPIYAISKEDAIKYALMKLGVLAEPAIGYAPDRTSA